MSLVVSLRHALPTFTLSADFRSEGRLTALFGPSGCGKTTVVNAIAGLLRPAVASVVCDGQVLADTARNIWLPAHKRQIGYVFQDARLLPHLTVWQNIRFGQWFTAKHRRYAVEADIVDLLALAPLLERRPKQLSGGERQRVAIARALLQSPRLLLMDEPLASLDAARKQEILPYIERLRDETKVPIVYVSHAVAEVTRLATDVVLMAKGRVAGFGPLEKVMPELARAGGELSQEAGAVITARVRDYRSSDDLTVLESGAGLLRLAGNIGKAGTELRLHVRATDVTLATGMPGTLSALNILQGTVSSVADADGTSVMVGVRCGTVMLQARITHYSARSLGLETGTPVHAIIKAMAVRPSPFTGIQA